MRHSWKVALLATIVAAVAGCGDGGVNPGEGGGGDEIAERFERLADSVGAGGYSPTAAALRHAAEIVRLTGSATEVTLTIDGETRRFLAVAEQIDFPNLVCSWPGDSSPVPGGATLVPDEAECEEVGTFSMRTLIAWEPENLAEVVRVVADLGATEVQPGVPDVMTGLPAGAASPEGDPGQSPPSTPDSAVGGNPGFLGEYLVRGVGIWWAVEGSQRNDLTGSEGACTEDTVTFDWARFGCRAADFRFEVAMRVEAPSEDGHQIEMAETVVAGVRLAVVEWVPPPVPPVDTIPVDPPVGPLPPVDPPPGDSTPGLKR